MTSEVSASGGGGGMNARNGSSLEILTLALVGISFVVVLVRGLARSRISRVVELSDILLPLTLVVAIAQSVCVRLSLSKGLGRHVASLTSGEISQVEKLIYASNLLFQLVLSMCEVIVVLLIKSVQPQRPIRISCNVLLGCIGVYSTLALAILAFQCSLPQPWLVGLDRCVDRQTFLTSFIIISIIMDAVTLILPIVMVFKLKTPRDKKIFVCILFGTRIALPLVTIPQIYRLKTVLVSQDPTWDLVSFQSWVQIVMNLSIITACLPSLGRMMWDLKSLGSGIRTTWTGMGGAQRSNSRDFGHELGLEDDNNGLAPADHYYQQHHLNKEGYQFQEKPPLYYLQQPSPALSSAGEKGATSWSDQVLVQVRSIGSFESFESSNTLVAQEQQQKQYQQQQQQHQQYRHQDQKTTIVAQDAQEKEIPMPVQPEPTATAASVYYLPRRPQHHYRRPPYGTLLSPVLERSPALGAELPQTSYPHGWTANSATLELPPPPAYSRSPSPLSQPHFQPRPPGSPVVPWDAASSLYDEDFSEIDIDSYYMGNLNTQISQSYHPSRTELVLDSMIEDLQRENAAAAKPGPRVQDGWI
ncbi:hypothetical protein ABEF93_004084 [Exophiala dermatitidis]